MIPSIESEEVFIDVFLQMLFVAVGVHPSKPVLEVSNLLMDHREVPTLIRLDLPEIWK